jgi:hypothetical protein
MVRKRDVEKLRSLGTTLGIDLAYIYINMNLLIVDMINDERRDNSVINTQQQQRNHHNHYHHYYHRHHYHHQRNHL